jgi:hypothetical protein
VPRSAFAPCGICDHDAEALRLDLAEPEVVDADTRVLHTVRERREDEAIAVQVGVYEEHCAADGIERDEIAFAAEIVQVKAAVITPGVAVEGRTAVLADAVGLDDQLADGEQLLEDVRWILGDVGVEPEHPVFVLKRARKQVIARAGQHGAALKL